MPKPTLKKQLEDAKADLANARLKNQQLEKSRADLDNKLILSEQTVSRLEGELNEAQAAELSAWVTASGRMPSTTEKISKSKPWPSSSLVNISP